jgi:hypothetical protein
MDNQNESKEKNRIPIPGPVICPKPLIQLPEIGDKNLACVILGIISIFAIIVLKGEGIPIVTGCAGAIGGFVVGDKLKGK